MNSACYYKTMNNQEYYDYEDRRYVNPVTSRDEQLTFANNLRSVANNDIAKIKADTYNLGTHVPSNLGGLTGSTGLWTRNYVSPKVESMTQGLRAVAQSSALENAMNNYLNQTKQKYQNAYRAAAKRARSGGGGGSAGGTGGASDYITALMNYIANQANTVDKENVGGPNTEDSLTKGNDSVTLNTIGDAVGQALGTGGGIPWRGAAGAVAGSLFGGPLGSTIGGVAGNIADIYQGGKALGWWGN